MMVVWHNAQLWLVSNEAMTENEFRETKIITPNKPLIIERNNEPKRVCFKDVDFNQEVK